jgi:hypothetical protein
VKDDACRRLHWCLGDYRGHEKTEMKLIPNFLHSATKDSPTSSANFAAMKMHERRILWWEALIASNTYRTRCKCYAKGMLYSIPALETGKCFLVDTLSLGEGEEVSIRVVSQLRSMSVIQDESTLKIRRIQTSNPLNQDFFKATTKLQGYLVRNQSSANARKGDSSNGHFFGFGNHEHNGKVKEFCGTDKCAKTAGLTSFMMQMQQVLRREFSLELASIVST